MTDDDRSRGVTPASARGVPTTINLGATTQLDLSWMPEDQRRALLTDYATGAINLAARAQALGVEVSTLRSTLETMASTTDEVSQKGNAVTMTHVHNSTFGRTEVIMGNTDTAAKGRLSKTQTGEFNWTPIYLIGGVIAIIVLISIVLRH